MRATLLKTIKGKINGEEFNYDSLSKDLNLYNWLKYKDNVKTINECSLKINNELFFNVIEELDRGYPRSNSTILFDDITDDKYQLNINKLLETCIILTDNKQVNFEYVPIFYFNGSNRRADTPLLVEFNIVINMLINKFPTFKNQLLTLGKIEMEKNILSNKSMEETINIIEQELLAEINILKTKNNELTKKLSLTEQLLLEIRTEKEESERRHREAMNNLTKQNEEAEKRHQETMEQLRKESEENENRFILQINELRSNTTKIVNNIKNNVKSNTSGNISKPPENNQKKYLDYL